MISSSYTGKVFTRNAHKILPIQTATRAAPTQTILTTMAFATLGCARTFTLHGAQTWAQCLRAVFQATNACVHVWARTVQAQGVCLEHSAARKTI